MNAGTPSGAISAADAYAGAPAAVRITATAPGRSFHAGVTIRFNLRQFPN
jgi:hypothetical protein